MWHRTRRPDVRRVAILIFGEVEVMDFAGPFEVFGVTRDMNDPTKPLFSVYTVAEALRPIIARNGLSMNPHYSITGAPKPDILVIPGGRGARSVMNQQSLLSWVRATNAANELTLSVCTGSLVLGRAGILDGLRATTHHGAFGELAAVAPNAIIDREARFVDNGHIVTSAGISAGIDMALYVVAKLHGRAQARHTAEYMEYAWDDTVYAPALPEEGPAS